MLQGATIVFDLDGTLVDTAPDLTNALNHALKLHGYGTVAPGLVREAVGRGAPAMIYEALGIESGTDAILRDFLIHYEANIANESRTSAPTSARALPTSCSKRWSSIIISRRSPGATRSKRRSPTRAIFWAPFPPAAAITPEP
jgi:phosphoglycolate phosphatase-like HAD superfamily hydrolase